MYPIPANATRIRYLQSTGTQYVDTGIGGGDGYIAFDMLVIETSPSASPCLLGGQYKGSNATGYDRVVLQWNGGYYKLFHKTSAAGTGSTAGNEGQSVWYRSARITQPKISYQLNSAFSQHIGVFTRISEDGSTSSAAAPMGKMQLYSFQLWNANDELVRSFVPVRVGSTGYLFDRVSGTLFGNAGTGDFVLGPDTFSQGVVPTRMMAMGARRKAQKIQKLRVYSDGEYGHVYDIRTDYPLSAGADVTGTVDGNPRSGTLDYNLYTVMGPGGYIGEFADVTPGEGASARWFDSDVGNVLIGYCEIIEE